MLQFNLMVLAFGVIAVIKLRESVEAAMLDVLLPTLLLMPATYFLHVPHVPLVSCYDVALYPIGIATIWCRRARWRYQRSDLWIACFVLSGFITDYINLDLRTALYNLAEPGFLGGMLAYFMGKLLIEQTGRREQVARRIALLLAIVGAVSTVEFFGRRDLFVTLTHRFFGRGDFWGDQYRAGFLRVKGPFMGAEEAGIVFVIGFFISLWLWIVHRRQAAAAEPKYLGVPSSALYSGGILLGLVMTLSRGPCLGAAAGWLIARIGPSKRKIFAITVALVLFTAGGIIVHQRASSLSQSQGAPSRTDTTAPDESKASAAYRTRLFDVYEPVAERGGWFGWSATKFPRDLSFWSIDNEYLLLWVTQGKIGIALFLIIIAEGVIALVRALLGDQRIADVCFYYCLAGMLAGLVLILTTVFLSGQGLILFFFCLGWIQSLPGPANLYRGRSAAQFNFRRVYT